MWSNSIVGETFDGENDEFDEFPAIRQYENFPFS